MNVLTLAVAGRGSFPYNLLLVIHLVAVATAFGVPLAYGAIARASRQRAGADGKALAEVNVHLQGKLALPALIVAAIAGMGLIGLSDGAWNFSDTWISASFAIVIATIVVSAYLLLPALKRTAQTVDAGASVERATDAEAADKTKAQTAMATGLLHLGLVATIVLMVWKPGA